MDPKDLVRRTQEAAWRSAGKTPVDTQRNWYAKDLNAVGRNKAPVFAGDNAQVPIKGLGDFLSHPITITVLAVITFAAVFGVMMWREGKLDYLWEKRGAVSLPDPKRWIGAAQGGGEAAEPQPEDTAEEAPLPNEMDAILEQTRIDEAAARAAATASAAAEQAAAAPPTE